MYISKKNKISIKYIYIIYSFIIFFTLIQCTPSDEVPKDNDEQSEEDLTDDDIGYNGNWDKITELPSGENLQLVSMVEGDGNIYAFLTERFLGDWNKYLWEYHVESNQWRNVYNFDENQIRRGSGLFWYESKVNMISGEEPFLNPKNEWFQIDPYDGSFSEIKYDVNGYFSRNGSGFWFIKGAIYFALGDVARNKDQYAFPAYNISDRLLFFEKDIPNTLNDGNEYGFLNSLPTFNIDNNLYLLLESRNSTSEDLAKIILLKYNLDEKVWINNEINIPKPNRREMLSFELNGALYIGGGIINQEHLFDLYKFNLADSSYIRVKDIPNSVRYTKTTKFGDRIFIYGSSINCDECDNYAIYEFTPD